jgi:hypothetical protein
MTVWHSTRTQTNSLRYESKWKMIFPVVSKRSLRDKDPGKYPVNIPQVIPKRKRRIDLFRR